MPFFDNFDDGTNSESEASEVTKLKVVENPEVTIEQEKTPEMLFSERVKALQELGWAVKTNSRNSFEVSQLFSCGFDVLTKKYGVDCVLDIAIKIKEETGIDDGLDEIISQLEPTLEGQRQVYKEIEESGQNLIDEAHNNSSQDSEQLQNIRFSRKNYGERRLVASGFLKFRNSLKQSFSILPAKWRDRVAKLLDQQPGVSAYILHNYDLETLKKDLQQSEGDFEKLYGKLEEDGEKLHEQFLTEKASLLSDLDNEIQKRKEQVQQEFEPRFRAFFSDFAKLIAQLKDFETEEVKSVVESALDAIQEKIGALNKEMEKEIDKKNKEIYDLRGQAEVAREDY